MYPATGLAQADGPLIVDDAAAANPDLVDTDLEIPDGVDVSDQVVRLPAGFSISVVAAGLGEARFMTFDADGNLLVAAMADGAVYRYPAADDGVIDPAPTPPEPLISGLDQPSSLALHTTDDGDYLYVGETHQVSRYRYDSEGAPGEQEVIVPDLPTDGHRTRTVAFGPDGLLYLSVGSSCNICTEEDERRAAIARYNPDGSGYELFATGLRNAVGLAFASESGELWATVNERDNQGNEIPPDLVTIVEEGANYGWPACQPPDATPQEPGAECGDVTPPTVGIQAHSAPLGLAFVVGDGVSTELDGDLLVVQHGSWNREPPAAPKLLQIDMEDGLPVAVRDFATGWQNESGERWGRPVGVVVAPDGSLIVSDDTNGLLYRISASG
jgi:glucose/arabinose dehydrogenase